MVMGDVLSVCLMQMNNFKSEHFAKYHPGGTLGKKLYLTAGDLVIKNKKPLVHLNTTWKEVIYEISNKRLGAAVVINNIEEVLGIVTDGDLRRAMEKFENFNTITAQDIMSTKVKTVTVNTLAVETLQLMQRFDITQVVVIDNNIYKGIVHLHQILEEGIL
jgi:arabinose-5-phosphate isomerase